MEGFTGGSLKLKGTTKKKKKIKQAANPTSAETSSLPIKTEAQLRFEERERKASERRIEQLAKKTHKERVKELNEYLGKMSEHHDIPRVGPG